MPRRALALLAPFTLVLLGGGLAAAGEPAPAPAPRVWRVEGSSPKALGLSHGRALRDLVRETVAALEPAMAARAGEAGKARPALSREVLEEIEGIAEGAGVPFDSILLENVLLGAEAGGLGAVAFGDATPLGETVHAVAIDGPLAFAEALRGRGITLVVEPPSGHAFVATTWPGMVASPCAMSAHGISVSAERAGSAPVPGDAGPVVPIGFVVRDLVEHATSLEDAVERAKRAGLAPGARLVIADGRRLDARVVQGGTPDAAGPVVREAVAGVLVGGDPALEPRAAALRAALLAETGRLAAPLCGTCLLETPGVAGATTLRSVVFEPQVGRVRVAEGGASPSWSSLTLAERLSPTARGRHAQPVTVLDTGDVVEGATTRIGAFTRTPVSFDSPVRSGLAKNDRVNAVLFRPAEGEAVGAVVQLPAWKERNLVAEEIASMSLAARGVATLLFPLPYQVDRTPAGARSGEWTLSPNLSRAREAWMQGMADAARASLVLERRFRFPPAKQGVMGISLGGHVAADAYGAYPTRFAAGAFVLAGGNVSTVVNGTSEVVRAMRDHLFARGVTAEDVIDLVRPMDPATYADPARRDGVLIVGARFDPIVPPAQVEGLSQAYGGAEILWLDADHTSGLSEAPRILEALTKHFRRRFGAP